MSRVQKAGAALEYSWLVQGQWFEIPRAKSELAAISDRLDELVDGEDARARLGRETERLFLDVENDDHPARRTWGGVGDRESGLISAVMAVEPLRARGLDIDQFVEAWSHASVDEGTDVWLREYQKKELAGRPAASGHELLQLPEVAGGQRPLTETYRAVISAPALSSFVVMSITTSDLAVFTDIVGYGDVLMGTMEFSRGKKAA
ncbi:hypothetical protein [Humibacter albus]|uniref:hypothetical protein n=1 Tax=Humibacter albus TaxID=427754 RepID=UPI0012FB40C1|nr:hypothetical protein [Humibacter albus]